MAPECTLANGYPRYASHFLANDFINPSQYQPLVHFVINIRCFLTNYNAWSLREGESRVDSVTELFHRSIP